MKRTYIKPETETLKLSCHAMIMTSGDQQQTEQDSFEWSLHDDYAEGDGW